VRAALAGENRKSAGSRSFTAVRGRGHGSAGQPRSQSQGSRSSSERDSSARDSSTRGSSTRGSSARTTVREGSSQANSESFGVVAACETVLRHRGIITPSSKLSQWHLTRHKVRTLPVRRLECAWQSSETTTRAPESSAPEPAVRCQCTVACMGWFTVCFVSVSGTATRVPVEEAVAAASDLGGR
jgi:hypothetical protein